MIDKSLMNVLDSMVKEEKKKKGFLKMQRMKGKLAEKSLTKNGNLKLTVKRDKEELSFIVLKSHKDKFTLAKRMKIGNSIFIEGIPKLFMIICTKLRYLEKSIDDSMQTKLI